MKKIFHPLILTVAPTFSNRSWVEKLLQCATSNIYKFFSKNFFSILKSDQASFKSHDQILTGTNFFGHENFFSSSDFDSCIDIFKSALGENDATSCYMGNILIFF